MFNKRQINSTEEKVQSHEVDVWIAEPGSVNGPELFGWYVELLDEEELSIYRGFHSQEDQRSYLVGHALLRTCLSEYLPTPPQDWRFQKNKYGRPEINRSLNTSELDFNLSHTRSLSACIVARQGRVGVDVEKFEATDDLMPMADRILSSEEQVDFDSQRTELEAKHYLLERWCLKEAVTKAMGVGLSADFRSITCYRDDRDFIRMRLGQRSMSRWKFITDWTFNQHCLAAAIFLPRIISLTIQLKLAVPGSTQSTTTVRKVEFGTD